MQSTGWRGGGGDSWGGERTARKPDRTQAARRRGAGAPYASPSLIPAGAVPRARSHVPAGACPRAIPVGDCRPVMPYCSRYDNRSQICTSALPRARAPTDCGPSRKTSRYTSASPATKVHDSSARQRCIRSARMDGGETARCASGSASRREALLKTQKVLSCAVDVLPLSQKKGSAVFKKGCR
eukprot:gene24946-biopygen23946